MHYKWRALALLWVAFFLQQGTRQIFGATLSSIQGALGATASQIGLVVTVFTFAYGLSVPFAGLTADLFNRKWMVVSGVFVFCLGIFASGFVSSLGLILVTYGILNGIGQSFYYPSATSIIGELHRETRATALSILQMGLYTGIIGCSAVSGYLAEGGAGGWRMPFIIFGGIGIVWAAVLALGLKGGGFGREERKDRKGSAPQRLCVENAGPANEAKPSLKEALLVFLDNPSALLLAAGFGMMVYVDVGFKTWMPSHIEGAFADSLGEIAKSMQTAFGDSVKVPGVKGLAALNAVLWHYLGAFAGVTLGGRISDRLAARRPSIRMETNIAGLALAVPFIVWMACAPSLRACCAAMALFGVWRGVYDSNLMASLFDIVPQRCHASCAGIMLCFGFMFGSSSPAVLGILKDHFPSSTGLASLGAFYLLGAVFILVARATSYGRTAVRRNDAFEDRRPTTND